MLKPLVIYHKNCNDGYGAAYAAWKKFGDEAEYIPMHYGDELPVVDGRDVYILDFSFSNLQTKIIILACKSLVWLDHHKSAFENWCGAEYLTDNRQVYMRTDDPRIQIILDNERSGCVIAWEYFFPEEGMPTGLMHIGDRDLWRFVSQNTKPFCAALDTYKKDFVLWDMLLSQGMYFELIAQGVVLLSAQEARVNSFSDPKKLKEVRFYLADGTEMSGLGCNVVSDISETGNSIAKQSGTFSLTFFVTQTEVVCSLRSIGDYDVTPIAKLYGGGGHKNAAGFKVNVAHFFMEIW